MLNAQLLLKLGNYNNDNVVSWCLLGSFISFLKVQFFNNYFNNSCFVSRNDSIVIVIIDCVQQKSAFCVAKLYFYS